MQISQYTNTGRRPSLGREMSHVTRCYLGRLVLVICILATWLTTGVLLSKKYTTRYSGGSDVSINAASEFDLLMLAEEKGTFDNIILELREFSQRINVTKTVKPEPDVNVVELRPLACRMRNFGTQPPHTSLILDMHGLYYTAIEEYLLNILAATSMVVIKEVFVIHGGLNLEYLRKDHRFKEFQALNFVDQIKVKQLHTNSSVLHAKIKAAKMAFGSVLVFADGNVMWTNGWLQPLLVELEKDPKTVASPLFFPYDENIKGGIPVPRYGTGVSWGLSTVLIEQVPQSWDTNGLLPLRSPALRGHVFAVKKLFFKSLEYFEDQLDDGGGENVDLSFKTWLCGGDIKIVPCSRIGIHFFYDPQKITNKNNIYVLSELWLDWYKKIVITNTEIPPPVQSKMYRVIEKRNTYKHMKCKSFYWYSESVPMSIALPHASAIHYGHLVGKSGKCATLGPQRRILLAQCLPGIHKPYMLFQLLADGRLITLGLFLHTDKDRNVVQQAYDDTSPPALWVMTSDGQLLVEVDKNHHVCATETGGRMKVEKCVAMKSDQVWKLEILN
ncbi:inactive polypeptide N-acetylgalactosaminyltransferase-like protein 5 [Lineus longissimus]|uniref:inactive polypeptide N-acetylgalactosaminyltransferase-like protein 5 n=1 Tax=Lineus longissimus TaxID=88925 RepID=UPI00315DB761